MAGRLFLALERGKEVLGSSVWGDRALSARQGKGALGLLLLSPCYYSVRQAPGRIMVAMVTRCTGGRLELGVPGLKKKRALVRK